MGKINYINYPFVLGWLFFCLIVFMLGGFIAYKIKYLDKRNFIIYIITKLSGFIIGLVFIGIVYLFQLFV